MKMYLEMTFAKYQLFGSSLNVLNTVEYAEWTTTMEYMVRKLSSYFLDNFIMQNYQVFFIAQPSYG